MMAFRTLLPLLALLLSVALAAADGEARAGVFTSGALSVSLPDEVAEGQPFLVEIGVAGPAERVQLEWLGRSVEISLAREGASSRGLALLGVGLDVQPGEQLLSVETAGGQRRERLQGKVRVVPGSFPEQRLNLPKDMVTPSKENLARIKREQELVAKAVSATSPLRLWSLPMQRPVPGVVTSAFGLRRILNGQPRSPHSGLDLDGTSGEPVLSAGRGRVALTGDFYYNGKSVFIDHGNGVFSMYFHLSALDVADGQLVERGQAVGKVGATGRATGPHLHFGLKILGQNVDPTSLFDSGVPSANTNGGTSKGGT